MKRILCLDVGTKRIGVAVSDPLGLTAQGVMVLPRQGHRKDFPAILELCRQYEVEMILLGLPLNEEGETGEAAKKIERFQKQLQTYLHQAGFQVSFETWDERYSTAEAEDFLLEMDVSRAKRKKVIDKLAAVMILTRYLREK